MRRTWVLGALTVVLSVANPALAFYPEWIPKSTVAVPTPFRLLSADFNGDGRPDVLTRPTGMLAVLFVQNDTLSDPVTIYQGGLLDVIVADADNDGKADVILSDDTSTEIKFLHSNGDGTFAAPVTTSLSILPVKLAAGDFDGDGKVDIAFQGSNASLAIYRGDGTGHFAVKSLYPVTSAPYQIVAADVDHDGHCDVVLATEAPIGYAIYYGNGDGTLGAPVNVPGAPVRSSRIAVADLDGDGDAELLSCEFSPNTVTVVLNLGSRSFAAPVSYSTVIPPTAQLDPVDLIVSEVTGDGRADVVVTLANLGLGTFPGLGNGTLGQVVYARVPRSSSSSSPTWVTAADFTGDGRPDLAVATDLASTISLMANAAGDATVSLQAVYPTISVGQTATFVAGVHALMTPVPFNEPQPGATGSVSLKEGATPVGSGVFVDGFATIDVESLSLGTHSITASFDGDDFYRPNVSAAVAQNVITGTTTATLTCSPDTPSVPYGTLLSFNGSVTSDVPDPIAGEFWLYTDGQRSQFSQFGTEPNWQATSFSLGAHSYYMQYDGNANQPPARSNVITKTVTKAPSSTVLGVPDHVRSGEHPELYLAVTGIAGGNPTGSIRVYDGSTLIVTHEASSRTSPTMPTLAVGTHYLRAFYDGDENFEPSQSGIAKSVVLPNDPFVLDVYASGGRIWAQGWFAENGVHFVIYRRAGSGPWTVASSGELYPLWEETSPEPGVTYAFRMEAFDTQNQLLATSNVDFSRLITFADDPLQPQMLVKAQHIQEILNATNALRAAAGLAPFALADAGAGQLIRASHITALTGALNEARVAFGAAPVVLAPAVVAGTAIRMSQIQDLREGLR